MDDLKAGICAANSLAITIIQYRNETRRTVHGDVDDVGYEEALVLGACTAYAALIQYLNITAPRSVEDYQRRLVTARSSLEIIREVCKTRTLHVLLFVEYLQEFDEGA